MLGTAVGVVEGVDMQYTGEVRKVHADAIQSRLDHGDVVLLSSIGYSPTGEIFNLTLEDVACQVGIALKAEKVIFLMNEAGVSDAQGRTIRELNVRLYEDAVASGLEAADDLVADLRDQRGELIRCRDHHHDDLRRTRSAMERASASPRTPGRKATNSW